MTKKRSIILVPLFIILCAVAANIFYPKKEVNLVYMSDSKYLPYMMTSLHSAILNKKSRTVYHVHVIAKDFSKADKEKLKQMEQKGVSVSISDTIEPNLDISHLGRFTSFKTTLQKLFIVNYLKGVDKVLYLDADTLVQKDLAEVFNTDIENKYVAAVKDGLMYQFPEHIEELGLVWRNFYFNSGVMLLNLKEMRSNDVLRHFITYFNTHSEIFGDQDILNVVFGEKVIPLSYLYNVNSTFFEEKDATFLSSFFDEPVFQTPQEVYKNAAILHFAGHKPWTLYFTHRSLKNLWRSYANKTAEKYHIRF